MTEKGWYAVTQKQPKQLTLSKIISVATRANCFWEGSKPDWFGGSLNSYPYSAFCGQIIKRSLTGLNSELSFS